MVITLWSAKGGVGTTVTAAGVALALATTHQAHRDPVLLVDLAGDQPAIFGVAPPEPGEVVPVADGVVLAAGEPDGPCTSLCRTVADHPGPVVIDAGTDPDEHMSLLVAATRALVVTRACYLTLRRTLAHPARRDAAVLVEEPGRSLHAGDVAGVLGVPILARVPLSVRVARAVDAGLLGQRRPVELTDPLGRAASVELPR